MNREDEYIGKITDVSDFFINIVLDSEPAENIKIDLCFMSDDSIAKMKSKIGSDSIVRADYIVDLFGNKNLYCKSVEFLE